MCLRRLIQAIRIAALISVADIQGRLGEQRANPMQAPAHTPEEGQKAIPGTELKKMTRRARQDMRQNGLEESD